MATNLTSSKRVQIDKASTVIVASLAIASFITVFSLVASKSLLSQRSYQAKVISIKEKARDQLKKNIDATKTLTTAYKSFTGTTQNIIEGDPTGTGPNDGDSAKIVLDALPNVYDFPATINGFTALLSQNGITLTALSGTDDQIAQQGNLVSENPLPVEMPFDINVSGSYPNIQNLIDVMNRSIRPIKISIMNVSGTDNALSVQMSIKTYYQPGKSVSIKNEVVK
jgi:hypothetical protein